MRPTLPTLPTQGEEEPRTPVLPERYADLARIGRGAMGEVRRVHDSHLKRDVAMKILRGDALVDEASRQRFFAEARLTAGLQHPAIVAVYDLGTLGDGRVWYTMPEIRGQTLSHQIRALHALSDEMGLEPIEAHQPSHLFNQINFPV